MENNHVPGNFLAETPGGMVQANNRNAEPVTDEIVICDECGDTLWDKVLAQTNATDNLERQLRQKDNNYFE